jgi:signal transduction histidine kinase
VRAFPSSLRGRLVLGAVSAGAVFAVFFGAIATWRIHQLEDRAIGTALLSRLDLAKDEVRPDGTLRPHQGSPRTDLVQVLGPDGQLRAATPGMAGLGPLVSVADVQAASPGNVRVRRSLQHPDVDLAALAVPLSLPSQGSSPAGTGALVVAIDVEGFTATQTDLLWLLVIGLVAVVSTIALLCWLLTGRALRSVTRLTERAEGTGTNALAGGLPVPAGDTELARLVTALNRMLSRLHEAHVRELTFAADAGHRLRTPVATLRAEAELALNEDDPAEKTAAIRRIMADADQLTHVVDRVLARSRPRGESFVAVGAALGGSEARWRRQGAVDDVIMRLDIDALAVAATAPVEIVDIVDPLVENAVRHSLPGHRVTVEVGVGQDSSEVIVDVTNAGVGIPAQLAPHVFDAWVSSRDASVAGGLGLWLARETARDLGGDVTLVQRAPDATTFRVRLPCGSRRGG